MFFRKLKERRYNKKVEYANLRLKVRRHAIACFLSSIRNEFNDGLLRRAFMDLWCVHRVSCSLGWISYFNVELSDGYMAFGSHTFTGKAARLCSKRVAERAKKLAIKEYNSLLPTAIA